MDATPSEAAALERLLAEVRGCRICAAHLPRGPRPVLRASLTARLLIIGQAPGVRVHESGIPWNDPSGDRLRLWLDLDRDAFYDEERVAIVPIGLCYPGTMANGGDVPPRPECAPQWHGPLRAALRGVALTLLVGAHAQARYLGAGRGRGMTETVRDWRTAPPGTLPLPHPSWRTLAWQKRNPWFDAELLPELRRRVHALLG